MEAILENKLENLKKHISDMEKVVIAYSGGVDSNFLLKVAKDTLGDNVLAVTICAMMHSKREIEEAKQYAKYYGVNHIIHEIDKIDLKEFTDNGPLRCYYCKKFIFSTIKEIASEHNIKYILDGTNLSDLDDYRPGLKALEEINVVSPLKNSKLTKEEIRILSKELNVDTYNKPSFSCLATRIPVNNKITEEKLRMIEEGENFLQDNNFNQYRVRLHDDIVRIEVEKKEINKFFDKEMINKINVKFKEIGFKYVTLDLEGYQMGSMN
ncbi:MAG: ATP-dependent sacrificial sulfur transferase LarE [Terrisporobacter sp.]|uniref:ATP-dependent sacrificial sulfur transferase LarE n=1 Tax=Terrisporobacter sp. TaxID=1965305 RepID=UPI002FCA6458